MTGERVMRPSAWVGAAAIAAIVGASDVRAQVGGDPVYLLCSGDIAHGIWFHKGQRYGGDVSPHRDVLVVVYLQRRQFVFGADTLAGREKPLPLTYVDEQRGEATVPLLGEAGETVGTKSFRLNRITLDLTFEDRGPWRAYGVLRCQRTARQF